MYTTMEPVLRQLTILDTLIRLEDIELYDFITEYVKTLDQIKKKH
jgi:hypothetical protein